MEVISPFRHHLLYLPSSNPSLSESQPKRELRQGLLVCGWASNARVSFGECQVTSGTVEKLLKVPLWGGNRQQITCRDLPTPKITHRVYSFPSGLSGT